MDPFEPSEDVEYTVLLVFPGFGPERENAESVVESALDWLNNNREEPGFRFAPVVTAHLEVVQDADEARNAMEADEMVAMVIMHDLADDERDDLLRDCLARKVGACCTTDGRRPRRRKGPWQLVFRKRDADDLPAHRIVAETLTAPVGEDEETGERVGELIAVMALGVMSHHFEKNPPHYPPFEE
ncbi:MAG TPA: hypothetical protein VFW33_08050 [Gemmataceae bacterium]|nr:hypothetical protein [Gemmataceae bacterium]